jgi:hypothetical protein
MEFKPTELSRSNSRSDIQSVLWTGTEGLTVAILSAILIYDAILCALKSSCFLNQVLFLSIRVSGHLLLMIPSTFYTNTLKIGLYFSVETFKAGKQRIPEDLLHQYPSSSIYLP